MRSADSMRSGPYAGRKGAAAYLTAARMTMVRGEASGSSGDHGHEALTVRRDVEPKVARYESRDLEEHLGWAEIGHAAVPGHGRGHDGT